MYRLMAWGGIVVLSIGSFVSCLALGTWATVGDVLLLGGCLISAIGFSRT